MPLKFDFVDKVNLLLFSWILGYIPCFLTHFFHVDWPQNIQVGYFLDSTKSGFLGGFHRGTAVHETWDPAQHASGFKERKRPSVARALWTWRDMYPFFGYRYTLDQWMTNGGREMDIKTEYGHAIFQKENLSMETSQRFHVSTWWSPRPSHVGRVHIYIYI